MTNKIIEWFFFPIQIQPFMNDSNSRNNYSGFQKKHEWIWGMCMSRGKFLKE